MSPSRHLTLTAHNNLMKFYNIFVHMFFFIFLVTLLQGNWNVTLTTHNNLKKFYDIFVHIFLNGAQKEIWKVQWALHIDKPHPTKRWKVKTTHPLPWKMPKKCKCRVRPAWLDPLANAQWRYVRKSQMHIPLNSPPPSWLPKARLPNLHPIGSQNSPPPVRNRHPSINTNITIHGTILSP